MNGGTWFKSSGSCWRLACFDAFKATKIIISKDDRSDVLYTINRPVLTAMLSVRRGPSTIQSTDFAECLAAIVEEPMPDSEDGQNRQIRIRLMRRLLDDPVLYYEDLDNRERAYLDRQRGFMLPHIREATGMCPEVRGEGIALLDPSWRHDRPWTSGRRN
jgi:uncharacterized protein (TIGR02678 family)